MARGISSGRLWQKGRYLDKVKLSVCVPTYNGAAFIEQTLQSILAQSLREYELIVCDDASSDGTCEKVAGFVDPRIRLERNPVRLGLVENWNRCLSLAHGEYVCIFHQDDVMIPEFLSTSVFALEQAPSAAFVFCNPQRISVDGAEMGGHWTTSLPEEDRVFSGRDMLMLLLRSGNVIPCQSVIVRASSIQKAGLFDSRLTYTPDYEMWLRLCLHGDVIFLAKDGVKIRVHAGQTSQEYRAQLREIDEMKKALKIFFSESGKKNNADDALLNISVNHLRNWVWSQARGSFGAGALKMTSSYILEWLKLCALTSKNILNAK